MRQRDNPRDLRDIRKYAEYEIRRWRRLRTLQILRTRIRTVVVGDMMLVVEEGNIVYPVIMADTKNQKEANSKSAAAERKQCAADLKSSIAAAREAYKVAKENLDSDYEEIFQQEIFRKEIRQEVLIL